MAADSWLLDVSSRRSRMCSVHVILPERQEGKDGVPGTTESGTVGRTEAWWGEVSAVDGGTVEGTARQRLFGTCSRPRLLQALRLFAIGGASLRPSGDC